MKIDAGVLKEIEDEINNAKACLFCVNIPLGEVMIYTFDLFDDMDTGRFIAIESGKLLKRAWLKDRFAMCGKSRIGFLTGAIYIVSILNDVRLTQEDIAKVFDKSTMSVRNAYKRLLKILPDLDRIDHGMPDRSKFPKCSICINVPPADAFNIDVQSWRFGSYDIKFFKRCRKNKEVVIKTNNIYSRRRCEYFSRVTEWTFDADVQQRLLDLREKIKYEISIGEYEGEISKRGFNS